MLLSTSQASDLSVGRYLVISTSSDLYAGHPEHFTLNLRPMRASRRWEAVFQRNVYTMYSTITGNRVSPQRSRENLDVGNTDPSRRETFPPNPVNIHDIFVS